MKTAILKRTITFKFGQSLLKGTKVQITQTNTDSYLVRKESEPNLEYLVSKTALRIV